MKKTYVRWLGAFGGFQYSLEESFGFEMTRKDEAACEEVQVVSGKYIANIANKPGVEIGLIVNNKAVFRSFNFDCYSFKDSNNKLKQGRSRHAANKKGSKFHHTESWFHCDNAYIGIIVPQQWNQTRGVIRRLAEKMSKAYNLPVYEYNKASGQINRIG